MQLYNKLNEVSRTIMGGLSIYTFLTVGNMTWYGAITHAKEIIGVKPAAESISRKNNRNADRREIDLFSCDTTSAKFIGQSIYGGRANPRIVKTRGNEKLMYGDVSGMYMSIMERGWFPCGEGKRIKVEAQMEHVNRIVDQATKLRELAQAHSGGAIDPLHYASMRCADYFIGELDFQENPHSLEPVLPDKSSGSTKFNVNRRVAVMTSFDLLMILLRGGQVFGCKQMLWWPRAEKFLAPWIKICREGKARAKHDKNNAMVMMFKLLANGAYGQTLKKDHDEESVLVMRPDQTSDFLQRYLWSYAIPLDNGYDIMVGSPRTKIIGFQTSRPPQVGAFVLAYSRLMIQQIVRVINPEDEPEKQPHNGDTDSLTMTVEQAHILRDFRGPTFTEAQREEFAAFADISCMLTGYIGDGVRDENSRGDLGWMPATEALPGQMTDELFETLDKMPNVIDRAAKGRGEYHDKFIEITDYFDPIPKTLVVIMKDPVTGRSFMKFRAKGIFANSKIGDMLTDEDMQKRVDAWNTAHRVVLPDGTMGVSDAMPKAVCAGGELMSGRLLLDYRDTYMRMLDSRSKALGIPLVGKSAMKRNPPSIALARKADASLATSARLLSIQTNQLCRVILRGTWQGRVYIGDGMTVPDGWQR